MNIKKIIGNMLFGVGILTLLFFGFFLITRFGIYHNVVEKACEMKGGNYAYNDDFRKYECFTSEKISSAESVCADWDKKVNLAKEKTKKSVVYLDKVISDEDRLVLDLWKSIFSEDLQYYNDHIIPVWIHEEDKKIGNEVYKSFIISYSVKIEDFYDNEVGNWVGDTNVNYVIIKKSDYSNFISVLKNTEDKSTLYHRLPNPSPVVMANYNFDYDRVIERANLLAEFNDFTGIVAAQKFPLPKNYFSCEEIISKFRTKCNDPSIGIERYGYKNLSYLIDKKNSQEDVLFKGVSDYRAGKCATADFNINTGKISCGECLRAFDF